MSEGVSIQNITPGKVVSFGKGYDNKPIEWVVLSVENNQALLFVRNKLCQKNGGFLSKVFDRQVGYWKSSELCDWLNTAKPGNFLYDAFSPIERNAIVPSKYKIVQHKGLIMVHGGIDPDKLSEAFFKSKIFLLSASDLNTYKIAADMLSTNPEGFGWWLRDLGKSHNQALCVTKRNGWVVLSKEVFELLEVRPALKLKLTNKILNNSSFQLKP